MILKNIMLVDDCEAFHFITEYTIEKYDHNIGVIHAYDGDMALDILEKMSVSPSLILLDINMPGMDGLSLLKAVRADAELSKMPVLMVTAEAKREQIVVAAEAGVNGYVVKPFTAITLKEKIDKIFERLQA